MQFCQVELLLVQVRQTDRHMRESVEFIQFDGLARVIDRQG